MILLVKNYSSISERFHTYTDILRVRSTYVLTLSGSMCINELAIIQMSNASVAADVCAQTVHSLYRQ